MSSIDSVLARGNDAVITGGASGMGFAVAEHLLARGRKLVLAAVDAGQFWILTHEEMSQHPVERIQRVASETNPPMLGAT